MRHAVGVVLGVIALPNLVACPFGDRVPPGAKAVNESGDDVQVFVLSDGMEVFVNFIPDRRSGNLSILGGDPCSISPLVARLTDGTLVERRPPPLCIGETWVIDGVRDSVVTASSARA